MAPAASTTCTADLATAVAAGALAAAVGLLISGAGGLSWPPLALAFVPPTAISMPCSTLACPPGYLSRWNADDLLCGDGACGANDTETCCVLGRFFSHSWRILAAANVSDRWEVRRIRFFQDEFCFDGDPGNATPSSEALTAPGVHHKWRGWPSGAAFSHHRGHGALAARAFAEDPAPTAFNPEPEREVWTSAGPCQEGQCFLGFAWESDIDRSPLGACEARHGASCASEALLRKAGHLRIPCAEVEQGNETGRFSEVLALQLLEPVGVSGGGEVWRTVAQASGLDGGLAQLRL